MEKKPALPELSYEIYRKEKTTIHLFLQNLPGFLKSTYLAGATLAGWEVEKFKVPPLHEL